MRQLSFLFCCAILAGCSEVNTETAEKRASQDRTSRPCTTDLAEWPIRAKIVGELEKIGTGTLCEGAVAGESADQPISLDGMVLSIGTPVDRIFADARDAGGSISDTYAGKAIVFEETYDLEVKEDQPWASQRAEEKRRYWLNAEGGKLIGFRACITYGEGGYRNQLNKSFANAFGPPQSIRTIAEISWAPELRMKWKNGATFRTSNDPNTARADYGKIPESFAWNDTQKNILLYRDLVQREDKLSREDFWVAQMQISQENCFLDDELKGVIQPLLNSGISPD